MNSNRLELIRNRKAKEIEEEKENRKPKPNLVAQTAPPSLFSPTQPGLFPFLTPAQQRQPSSLPCVAQLPSSPRSPTSSRAPDAPTLLASLSSQRAHAPTDRRRTPSPPAPVLAPQLSDQRLRPPQCERTREPFPGPADSRTRPSVRSPRIPTQRSHRSDAQPAPHASARVPPFPLPARPHASARSSPAHPRTRSPVARSLTLRPHTSGAPSSSRNRRTRHAEIPGEFPSGARLPRIARLP